MRGSCGTILSLRRFTTTCCEVRHGVIVGGTVAKRAIEHGVGAERIIADSEFLVPEDLFNPSGPVLDLAALLAEIGVGPDLRDLPWGEFQGGRPTSGSTGSSVKQREASHCSPRSTNSSGLARMLDWSRWPTGREEWKRLSVQARALGLLDRVLQIPFPSPLACAPNFCAAVWRCVASSRTSRSPSIRRWSRARSCYADVPSGLDRIDSEVPDYRRLPHGYGCIAIEDVNDIELSVIDLPKS